MTELVPETNKMNFFISALIPMIILQGSVAYVPQEAWIQNATVQENILFGNKMDETRYQRILEACALTQDLSTLPAGDQTEIGEKVLSMFMMLCLN
jgi:ABC-type multidrug transport system fused ATPase/permease subunit